MHGDHPDAARRAGAGQGDAIRLRGQRVTGGQRMFGEKRVHRFCLPCGADAVGKAADVIGGGNHRAFIALQLAGNKRQLGFFQRVQAVVALHFYGIAVQQVE